MSDASDVDDVREPDRIVISLPLAISVAVPLLEAVEECFPGSYVTGSDQALVIEVEPDRPGGTG